MDFAAVRARNTEDRDWFAARATKPGMTEKPVIAGLLAAEAGRGWWQWTVEDASRNRGLRDPAWGRHDSASALSCRFACRRFARRYLAPVAGWRVPRGVGIAASMVLVFGSIGYGAVKGDHVAALVGELKNARDAAANAAGFRIAEVAITGRRLLTDQEVLAAAGVTGDRAPVPRRRGGAHPPQGEPLDRRGDGAEALSRPARRSRSPSASRSRCGRRDGKINVISVDGTVLAPLTDRRFVALPLVVGTAAPRRRRGTSSPSSIAIRRSATRCAPRSWWPTAAGTSSSRTASTCGCRKPTPKAGSTTLAAARPRQAAAHPRHHGGRPAAARPGDRAALRGRRPGARGRSPRARRASARGATHERPRPRPCPQDEAAVAQALGADRGARHRHQQGRLPDRAAEAAHPAGAAASAHATRSKSSASATPARAASRPGTVIDLGEAEEAVRHAVAAAERMARRRARFRHRVGVGRPARERIVHRDRARRRTDRDATATSNACWRRAAAIRCATAAWCCTRCRSATRSTMRAAFAIRAACWASASASTCMSSPPTSRRCAT